MPAKGESGGAPLSELGENLHHLIDCKEAIVGAYISPKLFEDVISQHLGPVEVAAIKSFSMELANVMTDEQKKSWRFVALQCKWELGPLSPANAILILVAKDRFQNAYHAKGVAFVCRQVILGVERGESESGSMRSGGLIDQDTELLEGFLESEVCITSWHWVRAGILMTQTPQPIQEITQVRSAVSPILSFYHFP